LELLLLEIVKSYRVMMLIWNIRIATQQSLFPLQAHACWANELKLISSKVLKIEIAYIS